MQVESLFVYPVKSCKGVKVDKVELAERGFLWDRQWMVVSPKGRMLTMRDHSRFGAIKIEIEADGVRLVDEGDECLAPLEVKFMSRAGEGGLVDVSIWDDEVAGCFHCGPEASLWFTTALKTDCALVQFPPETRRPLDIKPHFKGVLPQDKKFHTGFADGYPILLVSRATIDEMNNRAKARPGFDAAAHTIDERRFRPNIIVSGAVAPFEEDEFCEIDVGGVTVYCFMACERCIATTINPDTRKRDPRTAPSNALAIMDGFRTFNGGGPMLGQNCLSPAVGATIRVGAPVTVTTRKTPDHLIADKVAPAPSTTPFCILAASSVALCLAVAAARVLRS